MDELTQHHDRLPDCDCRDCALHERDRLRAEIERLQVNVEGKWRPIETAPTDGTMIVVHAEVPAHARCRDAAKELPPLVSLCAYHPDAGFCVCTIREPTHWAQYTPPDHANFWKG